MITHCPALANPPGLIGRPESGTSDAASKLEEQFDQFTKHYSAPRLDLLIPEIISIARNSAYNTIGNEMTAVSTNTVKEAIKFAKLLPKSLPIPELAADPDGDISFDWVGKNGKMFSASIDGSGRVAYAGRFSELSKVHGIEYISDSCPQEILRGIEKTTDQYS